MGITIRSLLAAAIAVFLGLTAWSGTPRVAHAATVAATQCNNIEPGAATEIRCDVTVVNNLDVGTGATSSTVTSTICIGAPGAAICGTPIATTSADIVGSVNQCNSSVNAGGSTVVCNVSITNNITGTASTSAVSVNQCVGSAAGGAPTCDPISSVTGADVTQCNGSGNGLTLVHFECTVFPSTTSPTLRVVVNQCNGSANGGGTYLTCRTQVTTNVASPPVLTTTTSTAPVSTTTTIAAPITTATSDLPTTTSSAGELPTATSSADATGPTATSSDDATGPTTTSSDDATGPTASTDATVDATFSTASNPLATVTIRTEATIPGGELPETGTPSVPQVLLAGALTAFGALAVLATRRRHATPS